MSGKDVVDLVTGLVWPVLVGAVIWRLLPTVREVMASRAFSIKAGGAEITVQQASDQLSGRVEDLREQISALKAQVGAEPAVAGAEAEGAAASPIVDGVAQLRSVLWVDDHPENNVYERQAIERKGVLVHLARSTAEGLEAARAATNPYDVVITDMGREEDGRSVGDAGLELLRQLRAGGFDVPVVVYASAGAVSRHRDEIMAAGAAGATSSATELLEILGQIGRELAPAGPR